WASRITLHITDVRIEKLHDVTEEDVIAEGVEQIQDLWKCYGKTDECKAVHKKGYDKRTSAIASYMSLWDSICTNPCHKWVNNPWVWVIEFKAMYAKFDPQIKICTVQQVTRDAHALDHRVSRHREGDRVPAILENGEYVFKREAVKRP
ncbi:MAG: hypothetical protein HQL65_18705, partial [Magnetococcales bacterium]|nr:hypothetical protein [Magnetococcales bacterium]